jgi:uncharacterized protein with von Willebrand factor type A (vWA) domain
MSKQRTAEVYFIVDKSGSMSGLESDTIGGFNTVLKKQRERGRKTNVTTILFNQDYELLHDRENINNISPLREDDYFVSGCTALLDAVGFAIERASRTQRRLSGKDFSDNVLFVIITDGLENASREHSLSAIRRLIKSKRRDGWGFSFLGANMDAVSEAVNIGVSGRRARNFEADSGGMAYCMQACEVDLSEIPF